MRHLVRISIALTLTPGCAASVYTRQVVSPSTLTDNYRDPPEELRDGTLRRMQVSASDAAFTLKLTTAPRCRSARLGQQLSFARDFYAKDAWPFYVITIVGLVGATAAAVASQNNWIVTSAGGTAALGPLIGYAFLPNSYWGAETQTGQKPIARWEGDPHICAAEPPTPVVAEPVDLVASFHDTTRRLSWHAVTDALGELELGTRELVQRVAYFCGPATVVFRLQPLESPASDTPLAPLQATYTDVAPPIEESIVRAGRTEEIADATAREIATQCESTRADARGQGEVPAAMILR